MIAVRIRSLIGDISEVWRKPVVDQASPHFAPLRADLHLSSRPDDSFRQSLRDVLTSPKDQR